MWQFEREILDSKPTYKISLFAEAKQITYLQVIKLWQQDSSFRTFFNALLAVTSMTAYFWETPPITRSTVEQAFEFVLVNSPQLAKVQSDSSDFKSHFQSAKEAIVTFPNLGKDALLVVPCPVAKASVYSHLASFVREAPEFQQHLLWQTVGHKLEQKLNRQPIWVSTSGLGVSWLHIRLDASPKYYCFKPYRQSLN
ncbi:MAG TPA: hypothetical protein ACFCUY_13885 [Xenococcaceae cyanobacterium]